ncbi:sugar nucleotide-binding protein [Marinagarivorans algicola]|uniref:sugar nucleotide-binding protein n=1 Tax=Marinagarivorans algicola TaxID=1513270 RepID=UPI0006B41726|nr:sugar nucleotide-binding protein [Marinagarivorans algicola]
MAFRVLVVTDSASFYSDLEVAFEPLSLFLLHKGTSLLELSERELSAYWVAEKINCVVYAGFSLNFDEARLQRFTQSCVAREIPLMHLSSYQVFDTQQGNIEEGVTPESSEPLGLSLLAAENIILEGERNMVLRMPWTLTTCSAALEDEGLLDRACKALLGTNELQVSDEVAGFVMSWPEVARAITAMIQQVFCGAENWGVFHIRSSDSCSEAEFADAVARLLKAEGFSVANVVAVKGAGYLMQRSALLGGRRSVDDFGIQQRSFRVGLKGAVQRWVKLSGYIPALAP